MDVTGLLHHQIAPRALFDLLPQRRSRARFMVPDGAGGWRAVTWQAFADEVREIGLFSSACGLRFGERAAILAPNSVAWMSAALGIQAVGGVMVPIYPSSTPDQLGYVIEHSDARIVFVDTQPLLASLIEAWPRLSGVERIVLLDDRLDPVAALADVRGRDAAATARAVDLMRRVVPWSLARQHGAALHQEDPGLFAQRLADLGLDHAGVMLYTSGTTGRPKGVPLTHRNTGTNGTDWLRCNAPLLDEGMVDLLWLPMSHIFGFGEACLGNTLGWLSYLADASDVLQRLPEVRPQVFMSVPRYWEKLAARALGVEDPRERTRRLAEATGGQLRFCLSGGAGLKREVKELFHGCGLLIVEGYGLTEASPTLTLNRADAFRFDSVGRALPSVELELAEDGEILARGPSIFGGYHKDPEATRETFTADGWLKTGDIGRFTDDGFLQIVDRKKEILVTAGGKNVPPANIELRFADDPYVAHAVVYGDGKPYLTAAIWLQEDAVEAWLREQGVSPGARAEAVRGLVQGRIERVNQGLAHYETIKRFAVIDAPLTVESGLLTATLKVRRKKVYEAYGAQLEALYGPQPQ